MNCLFSGLPDTLIARDRPAADVTSVNTAVAGPARATRLGMPRAAVPTPPSARKNSRRERLDPARRKRLHAAIGRSVTPGSRRAPLLLQLGALALQLLKRLQRLPALVHPAEPTVNAREHIVIRRRARVEPNRRVQRLRGVLQVALPLVRAPLLEQRAVGLRIEREGTARVLQCLPGIVGLVVIGAQVHVRQRIRALALLVQG